MMGIWSYIRTKVRKSVSRAKDRDTYPPPDGEWFKGDPKICEEREHWHSFKADWIVNGVDWGPIIGHSATCIRCGWSDPCPWT